MLEDVYNGTFFVERSIDPYYIADLLPFRNTYSESRSRTHSWKRPCYMAHLMNHWIFEIHSALFNCFPDLPNAD